MASHTDAQAFYRNASSLLPLGMSICMKVSMPEPVLFSMHEAPKDGFSRWAIGGMQVLGFPKQKAPGGGEAFRRLSVWDRSALRG